MKSHANARQQGLTLVELLIALTMSSFLILGMTQVYISNRHSFDFQSSQASNMNAASFLQMMINAQLDKAGYRRAPDQLMDKAFLARAANGLCAAFTSGAVIAPLADASASGFCLRYQPAINGELACNGEAQSLQHAGAFIAAATSELVYIAIEHRPENELHLGSLRCNNVELLVGVADFRVEFLLGNKEERRFLGRPRIAASAYNGADVVRAVRYSALLASRPNQRSGMESAQLLGWLADTESTSKQRLSQHDNDRIYQRVSSTRVLRNLVP